VTTLRLETSDGVVPVDSWDDDALQTIPVELPVDLTPGMLRLLADCTAATVERLAADLESHGGGKSVLIGTHEAAARVRSMRGLRPRRVA
jgi:hypothetical protein